MGPILTYMLRMRDRDLGRQVRSQWKALRKHGTAPVRCVYTLYVCASKCVQGGDWSGAWSDRGVLGGSEQITATDWLS